jgi:large subunit ribosomal protein L2
MLTYKPITPSLRNLTLIDRSFLWKQKSLKILTSRVLKKSGGRNNTGRITVFQRGGGHKHRFIQVDFKRVVYSTPATVLRIEFDASRSSFIALIRYLNGVYSYILAPQGIRVMDSVKTGIFADVLSYIQVGNCTYLKHIPLGSMVYNIELTPGKGGQLIRSAGTSAQVLKKYKSGLVIVRLKSGMKKLISEECKATVGSVSNAEYRFVNYGKAGRIRWLGKRPHVRGYAMNPVDHPMGGRTHGGKQLVTPWGLLTKGKSTRKRSIKIIKD